MPHGRACPNTAPTRRPLSPQAGSCGQPVLFTFSTCRCPPLGSPPPNTLRAARNALRAPHAACSPPRAHLGWKPQPHRHAHSTRKGCFAQPAITGWLCTTGLTLPVGKPAGDEVGAIRLRHPMWGTCGGIRLRFCTRLCCGLPAAGRNACLAAVRLPPRRFQVLHPSPGRFQV